MKLSFKYRPKKLADVVGQPAVAHLQRIAASPHPTCILLEGEGGVGKTSMALAMAHELGCDDEFTDRHVVVGSDLNIDTCRWYWQGPLRFMGRSSSGFKVFIIEELEWLSAQAQAFLKDALERNLPPKTIVLATSNGVGKLSGPLLQRFKRYQFASDAAFAKRCEARLRLIWREETGQDDLPREAIRGWAHEGRPGWGWIDDQFSMRKALDDMEDAIPAESLVAA
jgi:replication-associated recombination protein RarA